MIFIARLGFVDLSKASLLFINLLWLIAVYYANMIEYAYMIFILMGKIDGNEREFKGPWR